MYEVISPENKLPARKEFKLTKNEIMHIAIAWIGITFAFSWNGFNFSRMWMLFPIILFGTLTGFIFHELAHKFAANYYGAYARFFLWPIGLGLAIFMSLLTGGAFVFAAPGAVYIFGDNINIKQNGIISFAGPFANLILAVILIIVGLLIPIIYAKAICFGAASINIFLGLFNMIPIPPLDGYKIFAWNKTIWVIFILIFCGLFIFL